MWSGELVKAAFAVRNGVGRLQGAVGVYADQLDAVVVVRRHNGVCNAAHSERVGGNGCVELVKAADAVCCRAGGGHAQGE